MTSGPWAPGLCALGLAALPLVACKPKAPAAPPDRDVRSWTLAEIETELDHNDRALAGEGIMVAMAAPVDAPVTEPSTMGEQAPSPVEEPQPPEHDDGTAPTMTEPAEPGPAPSAMPTTSPGPAEPESVAADAPSERNASRRRLSSRSRRGAETRCERICRLAEATCDLEAQICELTTRHPEEPRYHQACLRAEQQCEAASEACQSCAD